MTWAPGLANLLLLPLLAGTAAAAPGNWTWEVTVDVMEGTLEGFFGSAAFPRLKSCAGEAVDAYDDLKDAFDKLHLGSDAPDTVKDGLQDLAKVMGDLKSGLTDCKAAASEIESFGKTVENGFEHPLTFVFHLGKDLIVNGEDIFTEISQAVSLWEKQSYRDAGMQIGLALEKLVVGGSASAAADHATLVMAAVPALKHTWQYETTVDVFEGVLQGFFSSSEFPELKSCANNTVDAYEQLKDAFDKLHLSAEASDTIKQGLQDIATALGDLKQAMTECKASVSEIQQFADTLQTGFEHPVKFVYHLGKDLVVNGKDIFDEISQAVSLWEKQSYRDAGVQIGSALALLINGDVSNLEMN